MNRWNIYNIVFRRKWVILVCSLCGFVLAGITYANWKPTYSSTAELYIPYIVENLPASEQGLNVIPTGNPGNVIESEVEILRSLDNLKKVARIMTPAKIMAKYGMGTNATEDVAAQFIQMNLTVQSPQHSQIIVVTYSSRVAEIVQPVLDLVISNYIDTHVRIHLPPTDEDLARDYAFRQQDLVQTEDKIRYLKTSMGIVGAVQQEEEAFKQRQGQIEQENLTAVADLQEGLARANWLRSLLAAINRVPTTNAAAAPATAAPSEDTLNEYQEAKRKLTELENRQLALQSRFTTNNLAVQTNLMEIQVAREKLRTLEDENPGLLAASNAVELTVSGARASTFGVEAAYQSELTRIEGLKAKTNEYATLLQLFEARGTNLNRLEQVMGDLERVKAIQESALNKVATTMYEIKIQGPAEKYRGANISVIQNPSPPAADSVKSYKLEFGITAGGVVLGFGLAFLWELLSDRSPSPPKRQLENPN
jgi:uncharacterized protein involved in exopolysaccharide biosynthesis